jgi:hypothetical protein
MTENVIPFPVQERWFEVWSNDMTEVRYAGAGVGGAQTSRVTPT